MEKSKVKERLQNFLPQIVYFTIIPDAVLFCFIVVIVQLYYYFEISIVLPTFHDSNSVAYYLYVALCTFGNFNVISNLCLTFLTDSSVSCIKMALPADSIISNWKYCEKCKRLSPPRSHHCDKCGTCILKRDHHCRFSAYCIGHYNQRYFFMFTFYLAAACLFAVIYNGIYFYKIGQLGWSTVIQILEQHSLLFDKNTFDITAIEVIYSLLMRLNVLGVFTSVFLFVYHARSVLTGTLVHERKIGDDTYNSGSILTNIKAVLGERWYLTWISPFVKSDFPPECDKWLTLKKST